MSDSKVHPLKAFIKLIEGYEAALILGPMDIKKSHLNKVIKKTSPTLIIFVDGAIEHKKKIELSSIKKKKIRFLTVGDGDSAVSFDHFDILLPQKKDYSDFAFVTEGLMKSKNLWKRVNFLGFSSLLNETRFDHLFFNLQEIEKLVKKKSFPTSLDDRFLFFPKGINQFSYKGLFSILSLKPNYLKLTGAAEYRLEKWVKLNALSTLGLSNKAHGKIFIHSKSSVIVYLAGKNLSS